MKYLLDTHALLWLATNAPEMSPLALSIIGDTTNVGGFSMISLWELGIKASIGKLLLPTTPHHLESRAIQEGLSAIPLTSDIISQVMVLPWHHKDPFDRIIVATAMSTGMVLLSKDRLLSSYGINVRW
jgi:PIN domain nuclease of toxin-antitoxin system